MLSSAGGQLHTLLTSPTVLACVFSWLSAQFLKTIISLFRGRVRRFVDLFELMFWRTGGMPSSHSAVVSCVCICIAFRSGFDSDVFALSFVLFFITIRDALGVRRANGIHAHRINELVDAENSRSENEIEEKPQKKLRRLKEVEGHTPMEVCVGCLLGAFIGTAFSVLR